MMWIPKQIWAEKRLSGLPFGIAGDTAFRIFCTPELSHYRPPNQSQLVARARFHLRKAEWRRISTPVADIQTYMFEPDNGIVHGTVLIAHGWTSEASFMTAIAEPIRRAGFRVVLFDLPAHGLSSEGSTHLIDCARATSYVARAVGPLHAIVAHSFGGMISLVAAEGLSPLPGPIEVPRVALIASPNRLTRVTSDFSRHWGLTYAGQREFERRLERVGGRPLQSFTIVNLLRATGCKALIIHDRDDRDVLFDSAEEISAEMDTAELVAFSGFGHRNVLFAPPVIRAVASYLVRG
jgi:pimeloyl-ACP methyl ester carboxylesterase